MLNLTKSSFFQVLIIFLLHNTFAIAQGSNPQSTAENEKIVQNLLNQAKISDSQQDYSQAIDFYQKILALAPDNPEFYYNNLGTNYAHLRRYPEAMEALKKAIALNPKLSWAYFNLSVVYDHLGLHEESLSAVCFGSMSNAV